MSPFSTGFGQTPGWKLHPLLLLKLGVMSVYQQQSSSQLLPVLLALALSWVDQESNPGRQAVAIFTTQ